MVLSTSEKLWADMECIEAKHSHWLDSHISPENTKWVAENLEGFNQVMNKFSKLIDREESSHAQSVDMYEHKRPELLSHIEEFSHLHQQLAEKYNHLIGEVKKNFSSQPQIGHLYISDSGSPKASPMLTPDQKKSVHKSEEAVGFDLFLSSGGGSSDISVREGSDSSLSLSSDSDSESLNSINKHLVSHLKNDDVLKVRENGGYEILLRKVNNYEEQLLDLSKKLKSSEEEIASLKDELKKNESVTQLVANLQAKLESVQSDFEIQNSNLEAEKVMVLKLHNQVVELETQISDSDNKTGRITDELEVSREKLKQSEDEISRLKYQLSSEISERTHDLSVRDNHIRQVNAALSDANEKYSTDKAQLHSEISSLLEQQTLLKARVDSLQYEVKQQKSENLTMKSLHESYIQRLKAELMQKGVTMEDLNNDLDRLKLKYYTLMAEKDGLNAQLDTLRVGANRIEKEIERQRNVISEKDEEKREAIKQLCFSLEHYRSGYKELRQAYFGLKRHAVLA